jgi:hypothetical protein
MSDPADLVHSEQGFEFFRLDVKRPGQVQNLIMRSLRQLPEIIAVPIQQRECGRSAGRDWICDQMLRQLEREAGFANALRTFQQQSVMEASLTVCLRDVRGLCFKAKELRTLNRRLNAMQRVMLFGNIKR